MQNDDTRPVLGYLLVAALIFAGLALPFVCACLMVVETW